MVTKLKKNVKNLNSNLYKTTKTQIVAKLKNSNYDKIVKHKQQQNSKTQIVTKLINSKRDIT